MTMKSSGRVIFAGSPVDETNSSPRAIRKVSSGVKRTPPAKASGELLLCTCGSPHSTRVGYLSIDDGA